jgi:hypothetical protein
MLFHIASIPHSQAVIEAYLVALALTQDVGVLLQRGAGELGLGPEVGGQEAVGVGDGSEGGLEGVLEGLGAAGRGGVGVVDTGQLKQTLDGGRSDEAGTTGSRDELNLLSEWKHHGLNVDSVLTRTVTEPHLPLSLTGMEWGSPRLVPQ